VRHARILRRAQESKRLEPLAQRLHVDVQTEPGSTTRGPAIRLAAFSLDRLCRWEQIRDIYRQHAIRRTALVPCAATRTFAVGRRWRVSWVEGGVAPRIFLKKSWRDVLDRSTNSRISTARALRRSP